MRRVLIDLSVCFVVGVGCVHWLRGTALLTLVVSLVLTFTADLANFLFAKRAKPEHWSDTDIERFARIDSFGFATKITTAMIVMNVLQGNHWIWLYLLIVVINYGLWMGFGARGLRKQHRKTRARALAATTDVFE